MGFLGCVRAQWRSRRGGTTGGLLIQGLNYAPEPIGVAKYTTELAEFLAQRGRPVDVVAGVPHYPGFTPLTRQHGYRTSRENGVTVHRCPLVLRHGGMGIWRFAAPMSFAVTSAPVVIWRALRRPPAVILCVEPTLLAAPAAIMAAWLSGARLVLHVQDLEIDAAFAMAHLRGRRFRRLAWAVERVILRRFDAVATISAAMADRLVEKGVRRDRLCVIRNWVIPARLQPVDLPAEVRSRFGLAAAERIVLYAGHLGTKQGLPTLIAAARRLAVRPEIRVVIAGDGPMGRVVDAAAADCGTIKRLPLQPADKLGDLLAMADVHVLPQEARVADLVFPSKLGAMLASGRPIVATANPGTELATWLDGGARLVGAGNVEALALAIEDVLDGTSDDLRRHAATLARSLDAATLLPTFEHVLFDQTRGTGFAPDASPARHRAWSAPEPHATPLAQVHLHAPH